MGTFTGDGYRSAIVILTTLQGLRLLLLTAALAAAGMVLEIAAPRLAAPYVGTGALAWTVAIATFLAGLASGYGVGGWLADRGTRFLLPCLMLLAAGLTWITPALHAWVESWVVSLSPSSRVLVALPLAFLPVSFVLGTVPPSLARAFLQGSAAPGTRLGALAAAGAIGSVAGTFLAGFVLLEAWGLTGVFHAVAGGLVVSALLSPWRVAAPAPAPARPPPLTPARVWVALAALAGAAVLGLEILAGRFASDRLGASVFTWTSVIGVVLAGLAIGGLVGWSPGRPHRARDVFSSFSCSPRRSRASCSCGPRPSFPSPTAGPRAELCRGPRPSSPPAPSPSSCPPCSSGPSPRS